MVVDSIQTVYLEDVSSSAGSVSQVSPCNLPLSVSCVPPTLGAKRTVLARLLR